MAKEWPKKQVESVLRFADNAGYKTTDQIPNEEIDKIIQKLQ